MSDTNNINNLKRFEPHAHSEYSNLRLIDSTNRIEDLMLAAHKLGINGIALTDHEALSGHVQWLKAETRLKEQEKLPADFKCALGNEIYLTDTRTQSQQYYHLILIAKDNIGYRQLRELSSEAWLNGYTYRKMMRVPTLKTELAAKISPNKGHIVCTSACLGSQLSKLVLALVEAEKDSSAEEIACVRGEIDSFMTFMIDLFGDDFYVEIAPGTSPQQVLYNTRVKNIAKEYSRSIVIGGDSHYLTAAERDIHRAFLRSSNGDREVDAFYYDAHLMDNMETYQNINKMYSEADFRDMCAASMEISDKIEGYSLFHKPIIPEVTVKEYPKGSYDLDATKYPVLGNLLVSDNLQERYWANECLNALVEKNLFKEEYIARLEIEADVIKVISTKLENCMFSYFNTFQHYIDLFWECGSVVGPGRGSSCGYLSDYLLGLTQLDPIKWNLPWFRFLNKERVELPDIDIDLSPSKRPLIFEKIREERGQINVLQVATFGTAAGRSAIASACRGYRSPEFPTGIDVDISTYLSSLIPVTRGIVRTIKDCLNGNEEKGWQPVKILRTEFSKYPGLLETALAFEGLITRRGQHSSGVIFYNETPYNTTAIMRSPNGDLTTQYDLHDSEELGDTKFDILVTDIMDKISTAIDLLSKDGYFSECRTKREIYDKYFHPEHIDYSDDVVWDSLAEGQVQDVFQFNTLIGQQTVKMIKPRSVDEMSAANALIRLTAQDGQERPLNRYLRFKGDISLWYKEMDEFGLTHEEQKSLEKYYLKDYGVPASQEQLMLVCMDENISNFSLAESNGARKVVAKKVLKDIPALRDKFIGNCPSEKLGQYVWKTLMEPQMTYSFSIIHATAYTIVGIQTLILASKYPRVYWDCACLIVNSGSVDALDDEDSLNEDDDSDVVADVEEVEEDGTTDDAEAAATVVKKKASGVKYGRIAAALGKMKASGTKIVPPDVNKSSFTFTPDVEGNQIRYGVSGITRINRDFILAFMKGRPYSSFKDFLTRMHPNKYQAVNLIKSGAFDCFGDRIEIMREFIDGYCDKKKRITLQNMQMLIKYDLLPSELDFQINVFNFNKHIKKDKYKLDIDALTFYGAHFDCDLLEYLNDGKYFATIKPLVWDKIYKAQMDAARAYFQAHQTELLAALNNKLFNDAWEKDCSGSLSKWEMESISYYQHEHELARMDAEKYNMKNFNELSEVPEVDYFARFKNKVVPIYKIERLAGTVLDKDKIKKNVTLLTTDGVATVRFFGPLFAQYDKQISEVDPVTGKKKTIEKSMFSRGNKIVVCGVRDGDEFRAKTYSRTPFHTVEQIVEVFEDGSITLHDRSGTK